MSVAQHSETTEVRKATVASSDWTGSHHDPIEQARANCEGKRVGQEIVMDKVSGPSQQAKVVGAEVCLVVELALRIGRPLGVQVRVAVGVAPPEHIVEKHTWLRCPCQGLDRETS